MDDDIRNALVAINDTLGVHDELIEQVDGKASKATIIAMGSGLVAGAGIFFTFKCMKVVGQISNALNQMVPAVNGLIEMQHPNQAVAQQAQQYAPEPEQATQQAPVAVRANIKPRIMPQHLAAQENGAAVAEVAEAPVVGDSSVAAAAEGPAGIVPLEATADAASVDELLRPQI